jgi:DNA polymerase-3 subunit delta'
MRFSKVIGQENMKRRLLQMVSEGRVPHALMLAGPSGAGKMALALAFASYLLGEREDGTTSRNVEAMLAKWEHPDLHFTFPIIKPSGTSSEHKMVSDDYIRQWRGMLADGPYFSFETWLEHMKAANQQAVIYESQSDELQMKLSLKSSQGGYKVSIIWLPERMNVVCANKMLKLLEEPPSGTVFIMVSENAELLLPTISSRVQRIDVKPIAMEDVEKSLVDLCGLEEDMAHRVARVAGGNWLKAMEELSVSNENRLFLDMFIMLMRLAFMRNVKELTQWSETVSGYGREKQRRMLSYFSRMIGENFMHNFHNPELTYMTRDEENFSTNFSKYINEANIIPFYEEFERANRGIGQNANARMTFFDLAMKVALMIRMK